MTWQLNGIRIFVHKQEEVNKQIIARLQPLTGGTILQVFGYEDVIQKLSAVVVGEADVASLRALTRTGDSYTLTNYEGTVGDFFVNDVQRTRVQCICQTLRPDLDADAPVYEVSITLYRDE